MPLGLSLRLRPGILFLVLCTCHAPSMKRHAPEGTVVIRKYPNRRLYDVTRSKHLTLDELVELIKQGHEVQVIDSFGWTTENQKF